MLPALQSFTPVALQTALPLLEPAEARRVVSAVHREVGLAQPVRGVRRVALDAVRGGFTEPTLTVVSERRSLLDPFRKLLLETPAGERIECVRIPLERPGRFSVCVSSQVGCALACAFCATGRLGLRRNLETWEIVEQVRAVRRTLDRAQGERVHGVVFQGMGEPLANLDRVLEAIAVLTDPSAQAVDARAITVCTSGLPEGIRRLARAAPRVRLGWSLGSARSEVRERLMPIARTHSLADVTAAVVEHARSTGLAPMLALTPLAGVNDAPEDAAALGALVQKLHAESGVRPRVSLVAYNPIAAEADPFARQSEGEAARFRDALAQAGVFAKRRYSGGCDVDAACGQLAARG